MDEKVSPIGNALTTLKLTTRKVDEAIDGCDERELTRQARSIGETLENIYACRDEVIMLKVAAKIEEKEITEWSESIETRTAVYESILGRVQSKLSDISDMLRIGMMQAQSESENRRRRESFGVTGHHYVTPANPLPNRNLNEEFDSPQPSVMKWKLPKLKIANFNGTHLDWPRFWNQFQAEVDGAPIAAVTKLSYLRDYLVTNVRCLIDGLPFDDAGYVKAKEILLEKYGQETEVINAHIQGIISLPTITNANSAQIHAFYRKLVVHIQSLETMEKLSSVEGYV